MLTQSQDIRRRPDGSIDIDFYRQKGLMERRAYITRFFSGAKKPDSPDCPSASTVARRLASK